MKELTFENFLTPLQECVLRTLLYYDIFRYPLNADEVYRFLGVKVVDRAAVDASLLSLRDCGVIFQFGDLFSISADNAMIERRKKGNAMAKKFSDIARKKARLISQFPFVRSVMASGSLSKGYADEKSDIDFFIITVPKRLWIARTLLVLYKRAFLLNSHKYFCVNYFVDESHLVIEEKNLFTATELATVLPLYGSNQYHELHRSNAWLKNFFPNFLLRTTDNVPEASTSWGKWCLEKIISIFGDSLEGFCQRITLARWKKLYGKSYSQADFDIAFKSRSYASKNHPSNFQRVVMEAYEERLKAIGLNNKAFYENSRFLLHREGVLHHSTNGA
jgi:predicted nucleotidyltransferase